MPFRYNPHTGGHTTNREHDQERTTMVETASFGYWVRRRRKALDLTQAELARRVGAAAITIQKIEADERRPSRQVA